MFRRALSDTRAMMRDVLDRSILVAAAIAVAAIGSAALTHADPTCPPGGCPYGGAHSPSYRDGYKAEHDYYATPQNHEYLANEIKQGYSIGQVCQLEVGGGPQPANLADWLSGCADALHDLGFKS